MKIAFAAPTLPKTGALVAIALDGGKLPPATKDLDDTTGGALSRAIKASRFTGKQSELLDVPAPPNLPNSRVLLVGLGKPAGLTAADLENLGGTVMQQLDRSGAKEAAFIVGDLGVKGPDADERAAHYAFGALLRSYRFQKYRTKMKEDQKQALSKLTFLLEKPALARKLYKALEPIAEGVFLTRDMVSEPANVIYPESFAAQATELTKLGVEVQVLGEKEMAKLGMGSLLAVGQGSVRDSKLLVMQWKGAPKAKDKAPFAFVGKGVTFDTGGISLKPGPGMGDMKWDMGGAGVVIGLMKALAGRKAKANVVGICGLVENMPSGSATRPGDIVTSMSGQTIEILNTDAEGRLVLADALWYVQETFKPRAIVDLATLTGAIIVSLGDEYAGLFGNDDKLCTQLGEAGQAVGEKVWRLPLGKNYDKQLNCDIADMMNIAGSRSAGSIIAAQFLQRFVKNGTPWAHLDIAGVTWSKSDKPTVPKGGTGFGVRLLDRLVADHYEG